MRFFISIASIPQRLHLVDRTVISFARQTRPPERVLLVLPYRYTRWPLLRPNLTLVHPHPLLEFHRCPTDDGPGVGGLSLTATCERGVPCDVRGSPLCSDVSG